MLANLVDSVLALFFKTAAFGAARVAPMLIDHENVERIADVPYGPSKLLDIYRPKKHPGGLLPVAFVVHGGGFRFFSKNSHAAIAGSLAARGYLAFCIDYRLAPKNPFPDGLVDVIEAYDWVASNAEKHGGDASRNVLVGESAGANLLLGLCLHLYGIRSVDGYKLPLPSTRPSHVVLHCGLMQVSDANRFNCEPRCHPLARSRIHQIERNYLSAFKTAAKKIKVSDFGLADPVIVLESLVLTRKKLPDGFPRFFIPVGELDPIVSDSERLHSVLKRLEVDTELKLYLGEGHAFYTFPNRKRTKECWNDIYGFLPK